MQIRCAKTGSLRFKGNQHETIHWRVRSFDTLISQGAFCGRPKQNEGEKKGIVDAEPSARRSDFPFGTRTSRGQWPVVSWPMVGDDHFLNPKC